MWHLRSKKSLKFAKPSRREAPAVKVLMDAMLLREQQFGARTIVREMPLLGER